MKVIYHNSWVCVDDDTIVIPVSSTANDEIYALINNNPSVDKYLNWKKVELMTVEK